MCMTSCWLARVLVAGMDSCCWSEYKERVKPITEGVIESWLVGAEPKFRDIIDGKVYSKRHDIYWKGGNKGRANLKVKFMLGTILSQQHKQLFAEGLLKRYCDRGMSMFGYTIDVLVFEAIVYFLMETLHIEYDKAEQVAMFCDTQNATEGDERGPAGEETSPVGDSSEFSHRTSSNAIYSAEDIPPQVSSALQQLREFSAEEVGSLTNQYSEMLGQGSFGRVYKGEVGHTRVAVKVIDPKALKDIGHETFVAELVALTRFRHPHLINLMGYCRERVTLVYPLMERSLFAALHEYRVTQPLTWVDRIKVLLMTARAIAYLHSSEPPCIHRDIKTHNILLDHYLLPYLADFGFFMPLPMDHHSNCLITAAGSVTFAGTQGYLAPEFVFGRLGPKTDVYSFGVVILETYTGLVAFSKTRVEESLVDHCQEEMTCVEQFSELRDKKPAAPPSQVVKTFLEIAKMCTQRNFKRRCLIDQAVVEFERLLSATESLQVEKK